MALEAKEGQEIVLYEIVDTMAGTLNLHTMFFASEQEAMKRMAERDATLGVLRSEMHVVKGRLLPGGGCLLADDRILVKDGSTYVPLRAPVAH